MWPNIMVIPSAKPDLGLMHGQLLGKAERFTSKTTVVQTLMEVAPLDKADVDVSAASGFAKNFLDFLL